MCASNRGSSFACLGFACERRGRATVAAYSCTSRVGSVGRAALVRRTMSAAAGKRALAPWLFSRGFCGLAAGSLDPCTFWQAGLTYRGRGCVPVSPRRRCPRTAVADRWIQKREGESDYSCVLGPICALTGKNDYCFAYSSKVFAGNRSTIFFSMQRTKYSNKVLR